MDADPGHAQFGVLVLRDGSSREGPCSMRFVFAALLPTGALATVLGLVLLDRHGRLNWDHWDEVKPGTLYRSGQLTDRQFIEAARRYGIRTVVNLQMPGEEALAERALAKRLGVDFVNLPMPGDGLGQEWEFREFLKIVDDPARRPVLVHCARGTCRTGAAVAMYRFERDGWSLEDVTAELRRQTYHYGLLPGYTYALAKNKPTASLPPPTMIVDRNRPEAKPSKEQGHGG